MFQALSVSPHVQFSCLYLTRSGPIDGIGLGGEKLKSKEAVDRSKSYFHPNKILGHGIW